MPTKTKKPAAKKQHTVKVYSTQSCPWCHKAKDWLKEHNIKFKDIDVGADPKAAQEMVQKTGQRGVPQIEVDGMMIIGFDERALKKALGL